MCQGWCRCLTRVFLGMRATPKEETGVSVAEAALQQQLVVPGQLLPPSSVQQVWKSPLHHPQGALMPRQPHHPWMGQIGYM